MVLIAIFHCFISYSTCSLLGIYFANSSSFPPNLSKFIIVFDSALIDSNMLELFHYYSYALCNMATFHAIIHLDFTIMVDELGMTVVC